MLKRKAADCQTGRGMHRWCLFLGPLVFLTRKSSRRDGQHGVGGQQAAMTRHSKCFAPSQGGKEKGAGLRAGWRRPRRRAPPPQCSFPALSTMQGPSRPAQRPPHVLRQHRTV